MSEHTAEIVAVAHPAEVGMIPAGSPAEQLEAFGEIARTLAGFVRSQGLARRLSKRADARDYVQVEGWQFLGSMLGLSVRIEWTRRTPDYQAPTATSRGVGGWEARAQVIRVADGGEVGAAEMECLWSERNWADRDSYALRSMAETRAVSKALRLPLAFVMVLAGYAPTPAEEMDGIADDPTDDTGPKCPACGSGLWDNRADNEQRVEEGKKPMPAWKCRNKTCTGGRDGKEWIAWDTDHFDHTGGGDVDVTNEVKRWLVDLVADRPVDWETRYDDPDATGVDPESVAGVWDDPTPQRMAAVMWSELVGVLGLTSGSVTARDRGLVEEAALVMLDHPDLVDNASLAELAYGPGGVSA